ncbi:SAM-dependent DNA methyltransferase [Sphingobacterium multivorum]|uniref:site-specific DNA-methyltransferase (adenine-specific) n=1 Tax=Sphingobacterium multivorum TaxID=28454 RepID=A0ABX7CK88_SPHMU|nr:class I SAM-dependent DNA methyltransferase [Sphingobacterium multivorum]QQT52093.1 SAM-dependent DNA methyltransferase [Sphingobacterium multivorum]
MITGELKSQIDKIWNDFWTGGISNPLTVIEQFTYLIFLKQLDDKQTLIDKEKSLMGKSNKKDIYTSEQNRLRWSHFKELDPERMMEIFRIPQVELENLTAFDFMRTLGAEGGKFSQYMKGATFMIESPNLLDKVVQQIDNLPLNNRDTKGDLYEYMLGKTAEAGTNGQFRTPRHIICMMVELMQPQKEDKICDPALGTAGFLVNVAEYIQEKHEDWLLDNDFSHHFYNNMFNGMEIDTSMLRIASMNLQLHGIENPTLMSGSALAERNDISSHYSLILANPPFKGALDHNEVESSLLKLANTKKTEILFLSLMLRMLESGGRAAVIVPDGVLFGSSTAHKAIRKELVDQQKLHAVISMPSGVFKPYAGVSTAILIFTKTNSGGTDNVWYYDMKADGYSLDDKRNPIAANDIADIVDRYSDLSKESTRLRTDQSFLVDADEIRANGYDLSINRYKEVVYDKIVYESPRALMEQITVIDLERQALLNELKGLL